MCGGMCYYKCEPRKKEKTDTERRVANLSVNRDHPERKTEKGKPGKPLHG